MNAGAIIRLGWISLCSGETGWSYWARWTWNWEQFCSSATEPSCQLLYMLTFFFFFLNTTKTPHKADLKDEWKVSAQERAINMLERTCARNSRGFSIKLNIREQWSQTSGVTLAIFFQRYEPKMEVWLTVEQRGRAVCSRAERESRIDDSDDGAGF